MSINYTFSTYLRFTKDEVKLMLEALKAYDIMINNAYPARNTSLAESRKFTEEYGWSPKYIPEEVYTELNEKLTKEWAEIQEVI